MRDYKKVEQSHYLSQYKVCIPNWKCNDGTTVPFQEFSNTAPLSWYQAYNSTKHDRHEKFEEANLKNLINAVSGLAVLMASQFYTWSFSSGSNVFTVENGRQTDEFESSIGGFFRVKYPKNIVDSEKYDFSYAEIKFDKDIFEEFKYT